MSISVWTKDCELEHETNSNHVHLFSVHPGANGRFQLLILWPESMTQFCQLGSRVLAENGSSVLVFAEAVHYVFFCVLNFRLLRDYHLLLCPVPWHLWVCLKALGKGLKSSLPCYKSSRIPLHLNGPFNIMYPVNQSFSPTLRILFLMWWAPQFFEVSKMPKLLWAGDLILLFQYLYTYEERAFIL